MQEKRHLEEEQEEVQAKERRKKADANAALEHRKRQLIERYNEDMASYNEECTTLASDGVPKKFWLKKPTCPTWGRKAKQLKPPAQKSTWEGTSGTKRKSVLENWQDIQWAKKLSHKRSISLVGQIATQITKVNPWKIIITKEDILSAAVPNNKHPASFVDFILTLRWDPSNETVFLHTMKLALHTCITWLNLKYHVNWPSTIYGTPSVQLYCKT